MGGWQPAVDNLQAQLNTLDFQVSTLSGQEGTQASEISSLTSELSALQTEVSAIQQKVAVLADLSGASLSLSNPFPTSGSNGTPSYTPAMLNGVSVISIPSSVSVDGVPFKISAVATVSDDGGNQTILAGAILLNGSPVVELSGTAIGSGILSFEADFAWDLITKFLVVNSVKNYGSTNSKISATSGGGQVSVPAQSNLQFSFGAFWNNTTNPASVTLNQFKLSLL